jgi:hypothetical protein
MANAADPLEPSSVPDFLKPRSANTPMRGIQKAAAPQAPLVSFSES